MAIRLSKHGELLTHIGVKDYWNDKEMLKQLFSLSLSDKSDFTNQKQETYLKEKYMRAPDYYSSNFKTSLVHTKRIDKTITHSSETTDSPFRIDQRDSSNLLKLFSMFPKSLINLMKLIDFEDIMTMEALFDSFQLNPSTVFFYGIITLIYHRWETNKEGGAILFFLPKFVIIILDHMEKNNPAIKGFYKMIAVKILSTSLIGNAILIRDIVWNQVVQNPDEYKQITNEQRRTYILNWLELIRASLTKLEKIYANKPFAHLPYQCILLCPFRFIFKECSRYFFVKEIAERIFDMCVLASFYGFLEYLKKPDTRLEQADQYIESLNSLIAHEGKHSVQDLLTYFNDPMISIYSCRLLETDPETGS